MPCPKTVKCPLYPEFRVESSLEIWQSAYCNTDSEYRQCERFKLAESGTMPPPRMLPNGQHLPSRDGSSAPARAPLSRCASRDA
jgi:hypothetical protein